MRQQPEAHYRVDSEGFLSLLLRKKGKFPIRCLNGSLSDTGLRALRSACLPTWTWAPLLWGWLSVNRWSNMCKGEKAATKYQDSETLSSGVFRRKGGKNQNPLKTRWNTPRNVPQPLGSLAGRADLRRCTALSPGGCRGPQPASGRNRLPSPLCSL